MRANDPVGNSAPTRHRQKGHGPRHALVHCPSFPAPADSSLATERSRLGVRSQLNQRILNLRSATEHSAHASAVTYLKVKGLARHACASNPARFWRISRTQKVRGTH